MKTSCVLRSYTARPKLFLLYYKKLAAQRATGELGTTDSGIPEMPATRPALAIAGQGEAMEPLLYHLEWDIALEVLFTIILLSFFVERALSLLFENKRYDAAVGNKGLSELIALVVSVLVARHVDFDALAIIMRRETSDWVGFIVTGAIVAGGSKGSIKLFHDLLDVRSSYMRRLSELMDEGLSRDEAVEIASGKKGRPRKPKAATVVPAASGGSSGG